jgi:hypothetical protein
MVKRNYASRALKTGSIVLFASTVERFHAALTCPRCGGVLTPGPWVIDCRICDYSANATQIEAAISPAVTS